MFPNCFRTRAPIQGYRFLTPRTCLCYLAPVPLVMAGKGSPGWLKVSFNFTVYLDKTHISFASCIFLLFLMTWIECLVMPFAFSALLATSPSLCPTGILPQAGTSVMCAQTSSSGQQGKTSRLWLVRTPDSPAGRLSVIGNDMGTCCGNPRDRVSSCLRDGQSLYNFVSNACWILFTCFWKLFSCRK